MGAAVARVIPLKARSNNVAPAPEDSGSGADDGDSEPPAVSETEFALADDFIAMYQTDLRYVAKFGKWQVWRGTGWKEDETVRVFDLGSPNLSTGRSQQGKAGRKSDLESKNRRRRRDACAFISISRRHRRSMGYRPDEVQCAVGND